MKRAYNFSKINTREKRTYSFADIALSKEGIPTKLLIMAAILVAISLAINVPIGIAIDNLYFIPIDNDANIKTNMILLVYGIPICIACILYYAKLFNYRLIDLIFLYFKPKHEISISGNKIQHEQIKIDAFLERN